MTADERRKQLLDASAVLLAELRKITGPVYAITNALTAEADALMPAVATERTEGSTVSLAQIHGHLSPKKGKRNCGLCGEPGHRRTSCPKAHEVKAEKEARVEARDTKRKREATLPKGKRTCSLCRKPGHRAKNCPEAK